MRIILRASLYALVLFPAFLALGPATAFAGTTTLVTYYPAPNGNYSKVTLYPQAQPSGVCRSGAMYVDNTTGAFNYCVDSNINPNGGGLIGGTLAGTGAWGNLQTVNPVHYYDVANKGYVDAASGGGCYLFYSRGVGGSCLSGFTNKGSPSTWSVCVSGMTGSYFDPSGTCFAGGGNNNGGNVLVCCK